MNRTPTEDLPEEGQVLRRARDNMGITLKIASRRIGISKTHLGALEQGKYKVPQRVKEFYKIGDKNVRL